MSSLPIDGGVCPNSIDSPTPPCAHHWGSSGGGRGGKEVSAGSWPPVILNATAPSRPTRNCYTPLLIPYPPTGRPIRACFVGTRRFGKLLWMGHPMAPIFESTQLLPLRYSRMWVKRFCGDFNKCALRRRWGGVGDQR